jgi:hypothetical protein
MRRSNIAWTKLANIPHADKNGEGVAVVSRESGRGAIVGSRKDRHQEGHTMANEDEAKAEELRVILYRTTYDSVRDLLDAGDEPDHIRNDLLHGVPDDATEEAAATKRAAVEDALAGRPPRWAS